MIDWKFVWVWGSFLWLSSGPVWGQQVVELIICEGVVSNEPLAPREHFELRDRAYCWLRIDEAMPGQNVKVSWSWQGEVQHQEILYIGDNTWRTHCYKTLYQGGRWQVQVWNQEGELLASKWITSGDTTMNPIQDTLAPLVATLPDLEPTPGMPKPAPLPQRRGADPPLAPSEWIAPQGAPLQSRADILIVMPNSDQTAREIWQSLQDHFEETSILQRFWVMLPEGKLPPIQYDWDELSTTIARYEGRIFYDLEAQEESPTNNYAQTYIIGQGQGADVAWALTQRYPDRFEGALLVDCDCGYYQRGSMEVQRQSGMRYVMVAPNSDSDADLDLLQTTLNRLTRARVHHRTFRNDNLTHFEQMQSQQLFDALSYLTEVK